MRCFAAPYFTCREISQMNVTVIHAFVIHLSVSQIYDDVVHLLSVASVLSTVLRGVTNNISSSED